MVPLTYMSFKDRTEIMEKAALTSSYWGLFWRETNLPTGKEFDDMTLAEHAQREFGAIEAILSRALGGYGNGQGNGNGYGYSNGYGTFYGNGGAYPNGGQMGQMM